MFFFLYKLVIHSHIDYRNFIYGLALKRFLSVINPVHNTGICLATRAFCTTVLESLYIDFGKPPLAIYRELLQCRFTACSTVHHININTASVPRLFVPELCQYLNAAQPYIIQSNNDHLHSG